MKKFIYNPITIVFLLFASILIGSNICCTGQASNNENNTVALVDKNNSTLPVAKSEGVVTLTENNFDESIKSGIVFVDFWAIWCPPCRMMGPVIENVGKEMNGKASVFKIDIDKSPAIASKYNVQSIPTMIIFKDGKAVKQFVGITNKEDIIAVMNTLLK